MKIVHVTECWNGGIATHTNTLLSEHQDHELTLLYDPKLCQFDFEPDALKAKGVSLIPYSSSRNPLKFWSIAREINKHLFDLQPDIVHLHSSFAGVYGRVIQNSFTTVYCAHGWAFAQERGALKKALYKYVEKFLARRTHAILHVSEHEREQAKQAKIKAEIERVIPNGVCDVSADLKTDFAPVNPDALNLGFIGRLDHKKGFDILQRVFAQPNLNHIHLYVFGAASRDEADAQRTDTSTIHFMGWMPQSRLDAHIQKLDAVIMPSREEAFGLVAVEAMRNAKPVIASNRGALPEIIEHAETGYVFDLDLADKSLPSLLLSLEKHTLKTKGEWGLTRFEKFYTAQRMGEEIMALYEDISGHARSQIDKSQEPPREAAA
ncbi:MAG: glycosyltransferase [Pseudomonadota bacterium]